MTETHEQRIAREEATWTGPRSIGLMFATLVFALAVIYGIASIGTEGRPNDFTWNPWGTTPKASDLQPSSVSGLVR